MVEPSTGGKYKEEDIIAFVVLLKKQVSYVVNGNLVKQLFEPLLASNGKKKRIKYTPMQCLVVLRTVKRRNQFFNVLTKKQSVSSGGYSMAVDINHFWRLTGFNKRIGRRTREELNSHGNLHGHKTWASEWVLQQKKWQLLLEREVYWWLARISNFIWRRLHNAHTREEGNPPIKKEG